MDASLQMAITSAADIPHVRMAKNSTRLLRSLGSKNPADEKSTGMFSVYFRTSAIRAVISGCSRQMHFSNRPARNNAGSIQDGS
eukprot:scaffold547464_cov75-Attheya_sp.AAC.1